MFFSDDGPAFGVQFSMLVQESDNDPFQVSVVVVLYSSSVIFLVALQVDEKNPTLMFVRETQFSVVL